MLWDEIEAREKQLRDEARQAHQVQADLAPEFNEAHENLLQVYAGVELDPDEVTHAVARADRRFSEASTHTGRIYQELQQIELQKRGCRLVGPWWAVMTPERRAELLPEARAKASGWANALGLAISRRWPNNALMAAEEMAEVYGLVWWLEVEPPAGGRSLSEENAELREVLDWVIGLHPRVTVQRSLRERVAHLLKPPAGGASCP